MCPTSWPNVWGFRALGLLSKAIASRASVLFIQGLVNTDMKEVCYNDSSNLLLELVIPWDRISRELRGGTIDDIKRKAGKLADVRILHFLFLFSESKFDHNETLRLDPQGASPYLHASVLHYSTVNSETAAGIRARRPQPRRKFIMYDIHFNTQLRTFSPHICPFLPSRMHPHNMIYPNENELQMRRKGLCVNQEILDKFK